MDKQTVILAIINAVKDDISSRTYAENDINPEDIKATGTFEVMDAFHRFLAEWDAWTFANGRFEEAMAKRFRE